MPPSQILKSTAAKEARKEARKDTFDLTEVAEDKRTVSNKAVAIARGHEGEAKSPDLGSMMSIAKDTSGSDVEEGQIIVEDHEHTEATEKRSLLAATSSLNEKLAIDQASDERESGRKSRDRRWDSARSDDPFSIVSIKGFELSSEELGKVKDMLQKSEKSKKSKKEKKKKKKSNKRARSSSSSSRSRSKDKKKIKHS